MLRFKSNTEKNRSYASFEKSVSEMLPYSCHYTPDVVVNHDNSLVSVIKVEGMSFETEDSEILDSKKHLLNNVYKSIANSDFEIMFHTIRKKYSAFPEGEFDNKFANMLNERWKKRQDPSSVFINEHYVSIVRKKVDPSQNILSNIINLLDKNKQQQESVKRLAESYSELIEIRDRVVNSLTYYRPRVLSARKTTLGTYSEIMEFLGYIVNVGFHQKMLIPKTNISNYINTNRLYFGHKTIETLSNKGQKYAGIVSVKEYKPSTYAGMCDNFLRLPYEFIMTQSFEFIDRMSAINKMQIQQRRLMQAEDVAVSQVVGINQALDKAMSGTFAFGMHHCSVMCIANDPRELENNISQTIVEFSNSGISAVRENVNLEAAFWGQMPGNHDFVVRKSIINTLNLAGFASFHNHPAGKAKNNHWGDAVTVFNTTSGTPYFFNFHTRDVGHTMIIGPTGAGKTVLLNFLAAQAQKFKPKTFFFDKDRGAEVFIRGIGGMYTVIKPGAKCQFNPLQLDETHENKAFLKEWIAILCTSNGEKISAIESETISMAVKGCYKLPKDQRKLSNIQAFFGVPTGNNIAMRLKKWHSGGSKSSVFDNYEDIVDLDNGKVFGFDMTDVLKDQEVMVPVLNYIFHKITLALDGTPTMVVLDEAWALIDNPVFGPKIKDWLKVMRKLNAFVVFATQSVEDAANSAISDTLIQQCATQIFLPNLKATNAYIDVFMLSHREYEIIKTTDPSSRFFLLKQDNNSVVARLNLQGEEKMVSVLSGRTETVKIMDELIAKYGTDPNLWIDEYIRIVNN